MILFYIVLLTYCFILFLFYHYITLCILNLLYDFILPCIVVFRFKHYIVSNYILYSVYVFLYNLLNID